MDGQMLNDRMSEAQRRVAQMREDLLTGSDLWAMAAHMMDGLISSVQHEPIHAMVEQLENLSRELKITHESGYFDAEDEDYT